MILILKIACQIKYKIKEFTKSLVGIRKRGSSMIENGITIHKLLAKLNIMIVIEINILLIYKYN